MINKFSERYDHAVRHGRKEKAASCGMPLNTFLSEADTFIEYAFERGCAQIKDGMVTLNEWRSHKEQYMKLTETIIYDFEHFSRHDASHSVSILETIVMVVGVERIVQLSRGDLWLLLEAAYSHDIGMAMTGDELCELWKDKDFQKYLINCLHSTDIDDQEAANFYRQMDNLIHKKNQMDGVEGQKTIVFGECWPVRISNYVEWLVNDYIRKNHAARNQKVRKRIITLKEPSIPIRLYDTVVRICGLHTQDFERLFDEVPCEMKGIGEESVHPQFAAAMLRLGDVLDVENNRFSIYALEHMLEVPPRSMVHYGKHKAIRTIQITPKEIELTAESEQLEVCRETSHWFKQVDLEVNHIITNWNRIAPKRLRGCRLRPSKCAVYRIIRNGSQEQKVEYHVGDQRHFEIHKEKIIKLVEGVNVYNKFDFIREYVQNALDASKMQIWMDLKRGLYDDVIMEQDMKALTPFDIPQSVYEKYGVEVKIALNEPEKGAPGDTKKKESNYYRYAQIVIEDKGIGMEKECLDVISCIGAGWKKRERYRNELGEMPKWLKPTGGFAIGLQSAFMVSKRVEIETRAQNGDEGGRRIIMRKEQMGSIIEREECYREERGTKVTIDVPISKLLEWNVRLERSASQERVVFVKKRYKSGSEIFTADHLGEYIVDVIEEYLSRVVLDSVLPVMIKMKGFPKTRIPGAFGGSFNWQKENGSDAEKERFEKIKWEGKVYRAAAKNRGIYIWDEADMTCTYMGWNKPGSGRLDTESSFVCYKGIRMMETDILKYVDYPNFFMQIDYMGLDAGYDLQLSRNRFTEDAEKRHGEYVKQNIRLFMHLLTLHQEENENEKLFHLDFESNPEFVLSRILLSAKEDWPSLRKEVAELCGDKQRDAYLLDKKYLIKRKSAELTEGELGEQFLLDYGMREEVADTGISLLDFMEDYQKLVFDEDESEILLLDGLSDMRLATDKKAVSLTAPALRKLISEMDEDQNTENLKELKEYIARLRVQGAYVCPELLHKLHIEEAYDEIPIRMPVGENGEYQRITAVKKRKNFRKVAKDFYFRSYTNDEKAGSMVWKEAECPRELAALVVSGMPWKGEEAEKEPVLISPITEAFRRRMLGRFYRNKRVGQSSLEWEKFETELTSMEEFSFLISYVADCTTDQTLKENVEEVQKRYLAYAKDIWKAVFEQRGEDRKREREEEEW